MRHQRTYTEFGPAQEFAARLRGAGNIRIDRVNGSWVVSWTERQ